MKKGRQILGMLLAVLLVAGSFPVTVFAAETDVAAAASGAEILELPANETSALSVSTLSLDENGKVLLNYGTYPEWFDRLDMTGAAYAVQFYKWLEANADADGALADPTVNTTQLSGDYGTYYVYKAAIFENNNVGKADDLASAKQLVLAEVESNKKNAVAHITAAFHAFDRDHPEVFWLSGSSNILNSYDYGYDSNHTVYYSQSVYFLLQGAKFDIRDEKYQNAAVIETAISKRDSNTAAILKQVTGATRYEKIKQLNSILSKKNCYNTSSDLTAIDHDCRECVSALAGKTGTSGPVCEGYARAFKVLCDRLGIPCVLVDGYARSSASHSGEAHMWNYVQMEDGNWYAVDVTWNDPTVSGVSSAVSGQENEGYLLVGAETMAGGLKFRVSHPVSNTVSTGGTAFTNGPELSEKAYNPGLYIPALGLYLNHSAMTLYVGKFETLTATTNPDDATDPVTWRSGDTAVATVKNGVVTAVAPGTTTITATAGSCSATCQVTVKAAEPIYTLPTAKILTYTGEAQELVTAGSVVNGKLLYSLDDISYDPAVPTAADAGTYTVYYRVCNSDNAQVKAGSIAVTIAQKKLTPILTGSVSKVYDGTIKVPQNHGLRIELKNIATGDTVGATASFAYTAAEVGTTTVNASNIQLIGKDSKNYALSTTIVSADVGTILPAQAEAPGDCGHTNTSLTGAKEASCTAAGYTGDKVCADCGEVLQFGEETDPLAHTEVIDEAVASTCTTTGLTEGSHCSVCGTILQKQFITAKKAHTAVKDAAVEATCTEPGLTDGSHCAICGQTIKIQTEIAALGHDYVDGLCSRCGDAASQVPADPPEDTATHRLSGKDRYTTSLAIANELKTVLGVEEFQSVVLASSENFADALAGSYLAAVKKAPILIGKQKYAGLVCGYLNENLAEGGTVYILGGEDAMPDSILAGMTVDHTPVRLAGSDRYATNLKILEAAPIGDSDLLVATGRDFADSLSASATGLPILLVNSKEGKHLSPEQKAFLATVRGDVYILGGKNAVTMVLEAEIREAVDGDVFRLAGESRYETSIVLAEAFFPNADSAVAAYAGDYPDGLCGGPLARATNAPLLLTKDGKPEAPAYTEERGITSGYVLGGEGLISDAAAGEIFGMPW